MIRTLHIAPESWAPMESVASARLLKDSGIAGDRQTENITLIEEVVDVKGFVPGESQRPGLAKRLVNQAGIRARVLEEGEIHVGDTITEETGG